jgi:AbrB family looped-hinge helix DNA binding protein
MTIPKRVREAVGLAMGDVVTVEVEDGAITLRKFRGADRARDDAYLDGVAGGLEEWNSPEDDDAWRDL